MLGIETITHNGKIYAVVVRKKVKLDGTKFFTPKDYPFQIGVHLKSKGLKIEPHTHRPFICNVKSRQEFIHVDDGKIKITIYNDKRKKIKSVILNSGDSFLAVGGGHGIDFLSKTKLIEVKQGPYTNVKNDKEKI
jgi:hypothetical protein